MGNFLYLFFSFVFIDIGIEFVFLTEYLRDKSMLGECDGKTDRGAIVLDDCDILDGQEFNVGYSVTVIDGWEKLSGGKVVRQMLFLEDGVEG